MTPLPTLEDKLRKSGKEVPAQADCNICGRPTEPFAIVQVSDLTGKRGDMACSMCRMDLQRAASHEAEQAEQVRLEREEPWSTPLGVELKLERNRRIEAALWAVDPLTSPLSETCRQAFGDYIRALHRLTVDFASPANLAWPEAPSLEYDQD